jgi:hypothetical protein
MARTGPRLRSVPNGRPSTRSKPKGARADDPLGTILDDLESRAERMADEMLERYLGTIPSYRSLSDETLRQVRAVNLRNLHGFISALRRGRGPSEADLQAITDSASKRAREGVPLSALLAAYRVGAQLAWGEARSLIGDDPERLRIGLDLATAVMGWVDEVSGAVAQSYLEEFERLSSDREASRRDFLDGAISGALTPDEVRARAEALGLDPDVPFAVAIVALADAPDDDAIRRGAQHRLRSTLQELPNADRSLVVARGAELVIVFPAGEGGTEAMAAQLRPYAQGALEPGDVGARAGVGRPRESLAEMAGSYREASIALAAARAGSRSVAIYGEVLVEELLLRERGVSRRLAQTVLAPLDAHPDLKATLIEFLTYGPSLPAVAKRLFLHPNTVAYRLARVRELTGRDPKTPQGVAELYLALRAAQLVGDDTP